MSEILDPATGGPPADPAGTAPRQQRRRAARLRFGGRGRRLKRALALAGMLILALSAHFTTQQRPFFAAVAAPLELAAAPAAIATKPVRVAGVVVRATLRPTPKATLPTSPRSRVARAAPGEEIPVELTAYCLRGTTRRGRYVRQGIVAADPRVFPLARYVEVYVGSTYLGRFLVDDTGGAIKGAKLDIWTPTCREALLFGRRKGKAVLVAANAEPAPTPDVTHLMPYVRRK